MNIVKNLFGFLSPSKPEQPQNELYDSHENDNQSPAEASPTKPSKPREQTEQFNVVIKNIISQESCVFSVKDEDNKYISYIEATIVLSQPDTDDFRYDLSVYHNNILVVTLTVKQQQYFICQKAQNSITFVTSLTLPPAHEAKNYICTAKFNSYATCVQFYTKITLSSIQNAKQQSLEKLLKDDIKKKGAGAIDDFGSYAIGDTDVEMSDGGNSDEEVEELEAISEGSDEDDDEDEDAGPKHRSIRGAPITPARRLDVGKHTYKTPNKSACKINTVASLSHQPSIFVQRDDAIDYYSKESDSKLTYKNTMSNIKSKSGSAIKSQQMLLNENDSKLWVRDQNDSCSYVDVETGTTLFDVRGLGDAPIRHIAQHSKVADQSVVISGSDRTRRFYIDPRTQEIQNAHTYSSVGFSCHNTTSDGSFVTGNNDGEIRLYSNNVTTKNAKSRITGLGAEVVGIDVSSDSEWILATTPTFLLLIPTRDINGTSGFEKSMVSTMPNLIKLSIHPHDLVKYKVGTVEFVKPARFTVGEHVQDQLFTVASGNYLFTWKLHDVVKRKLHYQYKITKCTSNVIDYQPIVDQLTSSFATTCTVGLTDTK